MITYILFVVVVSIIALFVSGFFDYIEVLWSENCKTNKRKDKIAKFCAKYGNRATLVFWLTAIFLSPFFYEFGYLRGRGYVLLQPIFGESNKVELKKLNWYGAFQPIGTRASSFKTPQRETDVAELRNTFTIVDVQKGVYTSFDLIFEVNYPKFIQESRQSGLYKTFCSEGPVKGIFVDLAQKFQDSDLPVEELQENSVSVAKEWLEQNNIKAVTSIKMEKDTGPKNPERSVKID